jgi:hypothetical protein
MILRYSRAYFLIYYDQKDENRDAIKFGICSRCGKTFKRHAVGGFDNVSCCMRTRILLQVQSRVQKVF